MGLLFCGCSCLSVTACSTHRWCCVTKGVKYGPGCRCKNCSNSVIAVATAPGTQLEEELLHDSMLRDAHGKECVQGVGG